MGSVREIQERLRELGFAPGQVDGKSGRRTVQAVKAFQVAEGLAADGKVGPLTLAALFPDRAEETVDAAGDPQEPSALSGPWPLQPDCMGFYGGVGLHQARLQLPYPMRLAWDRSVVVRSIPVHEKVRDSAHRAFERIASTYAPAERRALGLDIFGGSLNVRRMRGGRAYSMHAWGIAIDFDPERNRLSWGRDEARLAHPDADAFWAAFEAEGWVSLGRARNFDWMHVQAARL